MATAKLDGARIIDWPSFHAACKEAFGFPDFYGANMDAWIDCLTYLRDDDGMSRFYLGPDEPLRVEVAGTEALGERAPEMLRELVECAAIVNQRHVELGEKPALHLVFL